MVLRKGFIYAEKQEFTILPSSLRKKPARHAVRVLAYMFKILGGARF
jgi:hypothetical protein